ncbi:hypothetical protein SAMN05216482_9032 [Streptomyces sp. PAN_FS17]|nr:hypothetical protein SAMN05216482_9032 [Streptomyces sp. PAN_FS17]
MKTRTVGLVMIAEVVPTRRGIWFKDMARPLDKHRISGLPVVAHDDKVLKAISETDLIRRKAAPPEPGTGAAVAHRPPFAAPPARGPSREFPSGGIEHHRPSER